MRSFQLDTKSYNEIEGILKHIAQVNDITDVESVIVSMTQEASIVKFEREKEAGIEYFYKDQRALRKQNTKNPSLLALAKAMAGSLQKAMSDPDIDKLISDFVMTKVADPNSGLRGVDATEYINYIVTIIKEGTKKIMQESQQQTQAEQQAAQQPSIEQSPAPERKYLHYTIYDRDKSALEGLGSRIMQWGREKSENIKSKLHNFFLGADLDTLADQIVAMATRKQYIGAAQKPQLKELIMSAAKDGFKDVTSQMQQTPTEESEKPSAQPEQQPAQAKQKQFPKPPTAAEAQASSEGLQKDPGILQMFETFKAQRPDLDDAKLFEIILDAAVKIKGSK